jgi:peptide/nickel transport system permease protein
MKTPFSLPGKFIIRPQTTNHRLQTFSGSRERATRADYDSSSHYATTADTGEQSTNRSPFSSPVLVNHLPLCRTVFSPRIILAALRYLVPPVLRRTSRNSSSHASGSAQPKAMAGEMSQWELIRRRFCRHRLAVFALFVLIVFYLIAAFAECVAPHSAQWRDLDYMFAPPQIPKFSFRHGLHTDALMPAHDPITLQKGYRADDAKVPLGFFVKGAPYHLWGRIPMQRRLFSIDTARLGTGDFVPAAENHPEERAPSFYFLGADKHGRDLYSRLIFGARISLSIGMLAVLVSITLGIIIGGISGYVGGLTDDLIQRFMEILRSFPQIPLWIALGALLPADWSQVGIYMGITVVLSLLGWTGLARAVRGKIMALREEEYAVAARLLGAGHGRILFKHLIPGFASHIIVSLSLSVPGMILGETALSFLGLGLRPPVVSWGVMLQDCMHMQTVSHYPWLLMPVVFIVGAVLAFNYVGDGIRDAADPYSSK